MLAAAAAAVDDCESDCCCWEDVRNEDMCPAVLRIVPEARSSAIVAFTPGFLDSRLRVSSSASAPLLCESGGQGLALGGTVVCANEKDDLGFLHTVFTSAIFTDRGA